MSAISRKVISAKYELREMAPQSVVNDEVASTSRRAQGSKILAESEATGCGSVAFTRIAVSEMSPVMNPPGPIWIECYAVFGWWPLRTNKVRHEVARFIGANKICWCT